MFAESNKATRIASTTCECQQCAATHALHKQRASHTTKQKHLYLFANKKTYESQQSPDDSKTTELEKFKVCKNKRAV